MQVLRRWLPHDGLTVGLLLAALLLALPILGLLYSLTQPQWDIWQHLADTLLADYVRNSLLLALGVGLLSALIGVSCAWAISRYQFVGRNLLRWLLMLPLAMPAYIIAYSYTGLLDFAGPLQSGLRQAFGWSYGDYWFPPIRSLGGAILVIALVLYPYVYMLALVAFREQPQSLYEAARTLGSSPRRYFFKVALPLARPAIVAGVALVMMEAFADYGTVHYFGVSTFTTGIFRTWFGMGNQLAAAQLSMLLCSFVFLLLVFERYSRRQQQQYHLGQKSTFLPPVQLRIGRGLMVALGCALPVLLGFVVPVVQLLRWALGSWQQNLNADFARLLWNSFYLAALAALVITAIALVFAYGKRLRPKPSIAVAGQVAGMGYAIPGTVIAVGVMMPLVNFDKWLDGLLSQTLGISTGLLLSGSLFALLFAYAVRFMTVGLGNLDAGLARIKPSMDAAARSLGLNQRQVLQRVHLPLLRPSLAIALLLIFVDVLKELPATLLLRPFNFNTLAVKTYELASDERLAEAALPAICIVLVGLLPIVILARASEVRA